MDDLLNSSVLKSTKLFIASATAYLDTYQRMELALRVQSYFVNLHVGEMGALKSYTAGILSSSSRFRAELSEHLWKQFYNLYPKEDPRGFEKKRLDEVKRVYGIVSNDSDLEEYNWYWVTYDAVRNMLT